MDSQLIWQKVHQNAGLKTQVSTVQARWKGAEGPATFRGPGWAQQSTYEKYYNQLYKVYDLCLLKYNITDT